MNKENIDENSNKKLNENTNKDLDENKEPKEKQRLVWNVKNLADIIAFLKDNIRYVVLALMCILALAVILIGIFALKANVVSMCLLVVIQIIIAAMLYSENQLVSGGVLLCELIAAILTSNIIVIVMAIVLYIAACFSIKYIRSIE